MKSRNSAENTRGKVLVHRPARDVGGYMPWVFAVRRGRGEQEEGQEEEVEGYHVAVWLRSLCLRRCQGARVDVCALMVLLGLSQLS